MENTMKLNETRICECKIKLPFPKKLVNEDNWWEFVRDYYTEQELPLCSLGYIMADAFGKQGYLLGTYELYNEAKELGYFEIFLTNLDMTPQELDDASKQFITMYYDAYMSCE